MEIDEVNFQELGRRARAVQDRALSQLPEPSADERLVAIRARRGSGPDPERSRPGTKKARAVIGGIAAAAFLCVGAWLLFLRAASLPLSYEVEGSEGELGQWLGSDDEPISLRFSEGSAVDLRKGARARVTATSRDGATISLERGSMRVDVVHRASTRWLIAGGRFEVHVLGTEFEVAWDTATEELRVDMMSGSVRVEGPCIASNTRVVSAPESLRVRCSRAAPVEAPSVASAEPLDRPALEISALNTQPAAPPPYLRVQTCRTKLTA